MVATRAYNANAYLHPGITSQTTKPPIVLHSYLAYTQTWFCFAQSILHRARDVFADLVFLDKADHGEPFTQGRDLFLAPVHGQMVQSWWECRDPWTWASLLKQKNASLFHPTRKKKKTTQLATHSFPETAVPLGVEGTHKRYGTTIHDSHMMHHYAHPISKRRLQSAA